MATEERKAIRNSGESVEPGHTSGPAITESNEGNATLQEGPIVFFDGVCNICNHSVNTLLKLDRKGRLRYASLQGPLASHLFGPLQGDPDSVKLTVPDGRQALSGKNMGKKESTDSGPVTVRKDYRSPAEKGMGAPEPRISAQEGRRIQESVNIYEGYDAFVKIGGILYPALRPLASLLILPPFRQMGRALYKWIARHRYRWFGKREFCDISNLKFKDRFLD